MPYDADARTGLDPQDWAETRALGHRMLDDMLDWLEHARTRPVWERMPDAKRAELRTPLPERGTGLATIYEDFQRLVLPYGSGNEHPRFMGWVNGGNTEAGLLAGLLVSVFNANCAGRDHAAIEIERQVIAWSAEAMGFPPNAGGILVTGSSLANLIAVLVARRAALGPAVRQAGLRGAPLTAYSSAAAHGCIARAMDMAGIGTDALRIIETDADGRLIPACLEARIAADRRQGHRPFLVVGTAGTVDIAAFDPLEAIAAITARDKLWFHVDGAFGATCAFSARHRNKLAGLERADSLAFDFHKWAQVPYDAGCVLVRDRQLELDTFAQSLAYLQTAERGIAGNPPWPRDLGPDLSRHFRALKVWMTLRAYGAAGIGHVVDHTCEVAQHLARRIDNEPKLERLAPVALNIVCFRYSDAAGDLNEFNHELVADLQESGIAAPSTTTIDGKLAIRAGIFNHRTRFEDADAMVDGVLQLAEKRKRLAAISPAPSSGP